MLCMIFRLDFFQNSFDFCFETKPKFQMNVARKERQKKMKVHRTEKPRENYFKRVFISLKRDLLLLKHQIRQWKLPQYQKVS